MIPLNRFTKMMLVAALMLVSTVALAETKVGAVNVAKLMEDAPQAQAASSAIKQQFSAREKELVTERDSLKSLEQQYAKDREIMSAADREKTEADLRDRLRAFKRKSDAFTEEFNKARTEALSGLQNKIFEAIKEVAQSGNYDVVLSENVLYVSDKVNLTDEVLARLKKKGD